MKFSLITFRSVTPAQRGEKHLQRMGYDCSLLRTPRWMQEQGCGYSIRVRNADVQQCVQIFREIGIPFQKIYLLRDNGATEELAI